MKGHHPGRHFIQDDPQRIDVAARVHFLSAALLGGHIGRRTGDGPTLGQLATPRYFGQAEICEQRPVGLRQQDVAGFDVPMHDPLFVGILQRAGHLIDQPAHLFWSHGFPQQLAQSAGFHELHDDVGGVALFSVVNHHQDIRVPQAGDGLCLTPEAFEEGVVLFRVVGRHHLDRHITVQGGLVGLEDGGHTSLADLGNDPVPAQLSAD